MKPRKNLNILCSVSESRQKFEAGIDRAGLSEQRECIRRIVNDMEKGSKSMDGGDYIALIRHCIELKMLSEGKRVHEHVLKFLKTPGTLLCNLILQLYGSCGRSQEAKNWFDRITNRNVYSWNLIIAANAQEPEHNSETNFIFERMPQRDSVTWSTMLASVKRSDLLQAQALFREMPERSLVSWTALLTAYAQHGDGEKALRLLRQMELEGLKPNRVTFLGVLNACHDLTEGRALNSRILESSCFSDVRVGNSLITMYGRCGSSSDARRAFNSMWKRDSVSWNSMIEAYSQNHLKALVPDLFRQMQLDGQLPDEITLISVLSACSHTGSFNESWQLFASLNDFGVAPAIDHYVCMVDLLSRLGHVYGALELIETMPFHPDSVTWRILLSASQVHHEPQVAARAARWALELDENHSGSYLLVSNIDRGMAHDPEELLPGL